MGGNSTGNQCGKTTTSARRWRQSGAARSFWHTRLAQAVNDPLALRQIDRIVAKRPGAEPTQGEIRNEGKSRLNRGSRFIRPVEMSQCGSEKQMRDRMI